MADSLYELLLPRLDHKNLPKPTTKTSNSVTIRYLNRLSTLQLESLKTTEPQSLEQSAHSALLSIQSLSTRSSKAVIGSADYLANIGKDLSTVAYSARDLEKHLAALDKEAVDFSVKYSRSGENDVLDRRKKALLMWRNVDRLSDILDLPTLLSSTVATASTQSASGAANYTSALDLHSHIKRLHILYPDSPLLRTVFVQSEEAMREMTSSLILSLRGQNIKLAAGMRTVGWLRRIAPELDGASRHHDATGREGSLGALFLICRLANLVSMLEALDPLRELADQESQRRQQGTGYVANGNAWLGGQQTEKYLKRYIEIFREQSFAIVSMFKSIFPSVDTAMSNDLEIQLQSLGLKSTLPERSIDRDDPLHPLPSALSMFPLHLVDLLVDTLKRYLPNVRDKSSRESLLTQVLYCAGSLGRLGGDFSMVFADLEEDENEGDGQAEWVGVMKKHRILAGRLELLSNSVGGKGTSTTKGVAQKVVRT